MDEKRAKVLLRAARDLLSKGIDDGSCVEEATAFYDGTTCDSYCLKEDIETLLDLDADTEPERGEPAR